jgi:hypothetical protein
MVGATLDHRLHDVADYDRAAADIAAGVDLLRADARVDADRIALWFFSGGGLLPPGRSERRAPCPSSSSAPGERLPRSPRRSMRS